MVEQPAIVRVIGGMRRGVAMTSAHSSAENPSLREQYSMSIIFSTGSYMSRSNSTKASSRVMVSEAIMLEKMRAPLVEAEFLGEVVFLKKSA